MEVDQNIGLAIDSAVAASRWRIAARFEGPETAARYRRMAEHRAAAATDALNEVGNGAARVQSRRPPFALHRPGEDTAAAQSRN